MSALAERSLQPAAADMAAATIRRVAYLVESAFNNRNRERFGIDWMIAQGIAVTVLDVGPLTLPELGGDRTAYADQRGIDIKTFNRRSDLRGLAATLRDQDLIIKLVGTNHFTPRNIGVFRAIAAAGTPYLMLSINAYPGWFGPETPAGPWARVVELGKRIGNMDPMKSAAARLPPRLLGVPAARFVVYSGRKSRTANRFIDGSTIPIVAHAFDYETYRGIAQSAPPIGNTAVFIDEYRPYHPDLKEMGLGYTQEETAYYFARMRDTFDRVETELGLKVVIAAMPRANYADKPGVFGDRQIEYGKTAQLVAASKLVLAHRSTAIGFAVMFAKPVVQIATRDIYQERVQKPYFDAFAEVLGKPIQFCDDANMIDLTGALSFDEDRYARYLKDYLTEAPSNMPFWQIVLESADQTLSEAPHP
jgi:hypothetical protein